MKISRVSLITAIWLVSSLSASQAIQAAALSDQDQSQQQAQGQIGINKSTNENRNNNVNTTLSTSNVKSDIKSTNVNGQSQKTENANNSSQSVNVQGDNVVYKAPEIPVATAYSHLAPPTAPCMGSSSAGGQGMNIGISFGTTWTSEECMILEAARSFQNAGATADAMAIRCNSKYAKAAPSCIALAKAKTTPTAQATPTEVNEVTAAIVDDVEADIVVKAKAKPIYSENGYYSVVTNPLAQ